MHECVVCWEQTPDDEMYDSEVCQTCAQYEFNGQVVAVESSRFSSCSHCGDPYDDEDLEAFDGVCEHCASQGY